MNITLIAAVGKKLELGIDNHLIWHIKEDMEFFKKYTMNKKIIMGTNTFNSLPGLLLGRTHIVLSRRNLNLGRQVILINSINDLLNYIKSLKEEFIVIGGAQIYKEMLPYSNKIILIEIELECSADVYFPEFDKSIYQKEILGCYQTDSFIYKRVLYKK